MLDFDTAQTRLLEAADCRQPAHPCTLEACMGWFTATGREKTCGEKTSSTAPSRQR